MVSVAVVAGGAGLLAASNPPPEDYERFAAEKLQDYLQGSLCQGIKEDLPFGGELVEQQCAQFVAAGQPEFQAIIARSTQRQNYAILSLYETNFVLPIELPLEVPQYRFQTLAIANQFIMISMERQ